MYSYKKLDNKLKSKNLKKSDLVNILNISSRTISKISKNEKIANHVLDKIAKFLKCNTTDLFEEIYENHILQILKDEKNAKISGGLYHELQVKMTYNSNHIEGSKLSENQTRLIFETRTIDASEGVLIDDIIETNNHFRVIDYIIDNALEPLNEDIIKHIHLLLKQGTKDSDLEWFKVGDYKAKPNMVGGKLTALPKEVPTKMHNLIKNYNSKRNITIEDIIEFHANFEKIHPFQDGNGRVGRLIALKECLRFNIVPFIIEDSKKAYYYRGLSKWDEEKGWLIDTCLDGQDSFKQLLNLLDIKE